MHPGRSSTSMLLVAWLLTGACGGNDDAADGGGSAATHGTCDRIANHFACIESTGPAPSIVDQKAGCLEAEGTWSEDPCPTTGAIGCCVYRFGMDFTECWYVGSPVADPEGSCSMMDGLYTPGGG